MEARLYLFDDRRARGWHPFRLTQPVGELLFGCLKLRERAERVLHLHTAGHLAGDELLIEVGRPDAAIWRPRDISRKAELRTDLYVAVVRRIPTDADPELLPLREWRERPLGCLEIVGSDAEQRVL